MWFDVPQEFDRAEGSDNVRLCRTLQPDILINNRAGGGCGDYDTPEQRVGGFDMDRPVGNLHDDLPPVGVEARRQDEVAAGVPADADPHARAATATCCSTSARCPTGEIEPRQVERLKEMGAVAGEIRREHLRHARRPVQAGQARRLHPQGQHDLPAHSRLARGDADAARAAGEDRQEQRADRRQGRR